MTAPHSIAGAFLALALAAGGAASAAAQTSPERSQGGSELSVQRFSGPAEHPRRHYRISDPAQLGPTTAQAFYEELRADLREGYAQSGDVTAGSYQTWVRFNTAPYNSMTHGRRYVNNYANDIAGAYGAAEQAGRFPVGSVVAKDSFVVTQSGEVEPGPLFVMEKMPAGFNYVTGDWRYSMVTADGTLAGRTGGPGEARVEFCISCHLAREAQDHLFFVPPAFRPPS
ncbi:MAG: hypothetical protein Tsb0032_28300 [Kiloniellaceae bacterium]